MFLKPLTCMQNRFSLESLSPRQAKLDAFLQKTDPSKLRRTFDGNSKSQLSPTGMNSDVLNRSLQKQATSSPSGKSTHLKCYQLVMEPMTSNSCGANSVPISDVHDSVTRLASEVRILRFSKTSAEWKPNNSKCDSHPQSSGDKDATLALCLSKTVEENSDVLTIDQVKKSLPSQNVRLKRHETNMPNCKQGEAGFSGLRRSPRKKSVQHESSTGLSGLSYLPQACQETQCILKIDHILSEKVVWSMFDKAEKKSGERSWNTIPQKSVQSAPISPYVARQADAVESVSNLPCKRKQTADDLPILTSRQKKKQNVPIPSVSIVLQRVDAIESIYSTSSTPYKNKAMKDGQFDSSRLFKSVLESEINSTTHDMINNEMEKESQWCIKSRNLSEEEGGCVEPPTFMCLKKCSVRCLYSEDELVVICKKEGLKYPDSRLDMTSNDISTSDGEDSDDSAYEVECILDEKKVKGKLHYFVKWKNYSSSDCTWEPSKNLTNCKEALNSYLEMRKNRSTALIKTNTSKFDYAMFVSFVRKITFKKKPDIASMKRLLALKGRSHVFTVKTKSDVDELRKATLDMLKYDKTRLGKLRQNILTVIKFSENRENSLQELKKWEEKINEVDPTTPYITVTNDVDCEGPPVGFKYVAEYMYVGIPMRNDPLIGCTCENCGENSGCCPDLAGESFPYDHSGRLKILPGYPICECNIRCSCGPLCMNRVVQKGRKVKLGIFRTSNGRGWGVKALQSIRRGQFVCEYIGEIITCDEAEQRRYDDGDSYLFDLDFHEDCAYTVDARHYGNVAHFINHSCDPNLHVFAVWINHLDPLLPRLAFFARKDVKNGEELTFDYRMDKSLKESCGEQNFRSPRSCKTSNGNINKETECDGNSPRVCSRKSSLSPKKLWNSREDSPDGVKHIKCLCGTKKCRGYLF